MKIHYCLSYGATTDPGIMRFYCETARKVGTAIVNGYIPVVKKGKKGVFLTAEPKEGSTLPVAVWDVLESEEHYLDKYELGIKKRIRVTVADVETGKEKTLTAFLYVSHEDCKIAMPHSQYLRTCLSGYRFFGLPAENVIAAFETARRNKLWKS